MNDGQVDEHSDPASSAASTVPGRSEAVSRPVPGVPSDNTSLVDVLANWRMRGFAGQLVGLEGGRVECVTCGHVGDAKTFEVTEWRRLEGASDPDDMMNAVAAVCPVCHQGGTLILGYGPNASIIDAQVASGLDLLLKPVQVPQPATDAAAGSDVG